MNGIESVIQAGQPPKAKPAIVPKPLQDLMGLVQYLTSKQQGGAAPQGSVAEGIAAAAAQEMMPPDTGGEEGMAEPDVQDVRDTALPAMRQEEMQDQQAMQKMAQQIQQQNRPPAGITSLEPDIIPLRAGGILGDDDVVGFAPGGLTPEFAGMGETEYTEAPSNEPRVEAYGPGGKKGKFTAAELRRMGYPEEEIKRRFASQAPAPAPATPKPSKPPVAIYKVPNAPGIAGVAKPSVPAMAAAEPPEVNPYEKDVRAALDKKFDMAQPTVADVAAERKAALAAAGITGPAGQETEKGIKQLEELYQQQQAAREEDKKGRAMRGLQEFLLAGARGGKAWQNLANAGRGGLAYQDRMRAQDEAYNKLQNEQKVLMIQMRATVEGLRRDEAKGDFDSYDKRMNQYQQLRKAFDNNQMHLVGQAYQVAEQAATRRESTAARRDIANQQAQTRAALAQLRGAGGVKPPSMRDAMLLDQAVNSKFFTGAVTPEMRSYLGRSEAGKRVLNDIANGRVKYDPRTGGWGAAEPAIARAAEMYKRDMLASTGREGGISTLDQAMRDLGGLQ